MFSTVIFRMDDICPDMNYTNFARARDLFLRYGVSPLIGVVPFNKDTYLKGEREKGISIADQQVWDELKRLVHEEHWDVALHGFDHVYLTDQPGILAINQKSEFAGVSHAQQREKIENGKQRLCELGLEPICFMAPSHSFDSVTIQVLKECGIRYITDGKGIFPYEIEGMTCIPVPYSSFWNFPVGLYTICLHTNTMRERDFARLERFLQKYSNRCLSFSEATAQAEQYAQKKWVWVVNRGVFLYMKTALKAASAILRLRRR